MDNWDILWYSWDFNIINSMMVIVLKTIGGNLLLGYLPSIKLGLSALINVQNSL